MARAPTAVTEARRKVASTSKAALNPSTPSLWYQSMIGRWNLISTVLGGTATMRAAGKALLPQHEGESDPRYRERLNTAVLTNYTKLTLGHWVGKPFVKPANFTGDTDPQLAALGPDMDLCGNELTVILKDWFTKGIAKQVAYCLVEYPELPDAIQAREDKTITLADVQKYNLRPYWVILPAEAVIDAREERVNGESEFTHVRFWDNQTIYDGFEEKVIARIKEIKRVVGEDGTITVQWRHWTKKGNRDVWEDGAWEQMKGIDRITLVKFDTQELELEDLAYINITHWQSNADQRTALTVSRFPILSGTGVAEDTVITIGPYAFLSARDANARWGYVEYNGAGLEAGRKDLGDLEEAMAMYGAEALKQRPDRETATSRVIDNAESTAPLQVHVFNFVSCVEMALYYTARWMGLPEDTIGKVEISTDFAISKEESQKIDNMKELRKSGDISRKQLLTALKTAKALPESFDIEANEKEMVAEANAKADLAAESAKKLAEAQPKPDPQPKPGQKKETT